VFILLKINQLTYIEGLSITYFQFCNYLNISILYIPKLIKVYQYYPILRRYHIEIQQHTVLIKA